MNKYIYIFFLSLISTLNLYAEELSFDHSHKIWNEILQEYVKVDNQRSSVNYKALHKNPGLLARYIALIEKVSKEDYKKFSNDQKLSFLINAYNALTLKLIIDHYPVDSIKDIGGWLKKPWKIKFFKLFGQEQYLESY